MPFAESPDGTRIFYERFGESGPPVLLIMGFTMRGQAWHELAGLLSDAHQVITYDNRGVGQSDVPRGLYRMQHMARDARAVIEDAGWEGAHVVGVSMGGMIAQELALSHRERVRSLALIATHAGGPRALLPRGRGIRRFLEANLTRDPERRIRAVERLLFPPEYLERCDRARLRERLASEFSHEMPKRARRAQLAAVLRHNTASRLPALDGIGTLLVRPGRDLLIRPGEVDRLHQLLPSARLLRFDEAGHGIIRQCPRELDRHLRAHVQRQS